MADADKLPQEMDNIADDEPEVIQPADLPPVQPESDGAEDYMKRFEAVEERTAICRTVAASITQQADQDQRLFACMKFIAEQQKLNEEMYDLMVEMSNFLGSR